MSNSPDTWFDQLEDQQKPILLQLRQLILTANSAFREEIKWGQPCYSINALTCYLQKSKSHVNLGFQQGAHLSDPDKALQGAGKNMRRVKIAFNDTVNQTIISALIKEAIKYDAR